ncbi:serine acetyltransferase [Nitrospira sp. KM1]|nr:serine O-acetyltransferase EpsC [Nitrospira sp. KM1]BCA52998.1 serine acetyltransferase [Nitrospira sp. KM1]
MQRQEPAGTTWNLDQIVTELRTSRESMHNIRHQGRIRELPSRKELLDIVEGLCAALFPTHYGRSDLNETNVDYFVGHTLNQTLPLLQDQVRRGLLFASDADEQNDLSLARGASRIIGEFAIQLPAIRGLLFTDLQAAYQGDPAATSASEILLCYPGMTAIIYYRIAHALHELGAPLVARLVSDIAHSLTGIDIHPAAQIDAQFFIDHGTGVVIGETTVIGKRVRLYQAVTLGAKRFTEDEQGVLVKGEPRHPIVEDDVVIYAGATILGRITIGRGSVIGGNVWLTQSVPPGSHVMQAQMRTSATIQPKSLSERIGQWSI